LIAVPRVSAAFWQLLAFVANYATRDPLGIDVSGNNRLHI